MLRLSKVASKVLSKVTSKVGCALFAATTLGAVVVGCSADEDGGESPTDPRVASAEAGTSGEGGSSGDAAASADGGSTKVDADAATGGTTYAGEATYYDADGTGACGFAASTDFMVTAMNGAQYSKAICGKCVDVTGPLGSVVVRIVDKCPGCKWGDLDLSQTAFAKIAKLSAGRVKITWRYVACP